MAGGQADVGELGKEASRRWGRSPWSPEGARGVAAAAMLGMPGDGDHGAVAKGEAGEGRRRPRRGGGGSEAGQGRRRGGAGLRRRRRRRRGSPEAAVRRGNWGDFAKISQSPQRNGAESTFSHGCRLQP